MTDLDERYQNLRREFVALLAAEKAVADPIKRKHAQLAAEEIEEATEDLQREYAIKFEVVRQMKGARREDLEKAVFGSKGSPRYKKFVELAGGQLRARTTAENRVEEQRKAAIQKIDDLHESLGVTYTGPLKWGEDTYPGFTVAELDNAPFYLNNGVAWPTGKNAAEVVAWSNEHKAEIQALAEHYDGDN